MTEKIKLPMWFWIASVLALLWNLLGVGAFFAQMFMSPETLAQMTEAQRMALATNPLWFNVAYGTSVIAGALGCVCMLLRNKLAIPLFMISLLSILVQMFYSFFMSEHVANYGPGEIIMPIMIIMIGISLTWFARGSHQKGWIN